MMFQKASLLQTSFLEGGCGVEYVSKVWFYFERRGVFLIACQFTCLCFICIIYLYLCICLSLSLSLYLQNYISTYLSTHPSMYLPIYLSLCICLYISPSLSLAFIYISAYLSPYTYACMYVCAFLDIKEDHLPKTKELRPACAQKYILQITYLLCIITFSLSYPCCIHHYTLLNISPLSLSVPCCNHDQHFANNSMSMFDCNRHH